MARNKTRRRAMTDSFATEARLERGKGLAGVIPPRRSSSTHTAPFSAHTVASLNKRGDHMCARDIERLTAQAPIGWRNL